MKANAILIFVSFPETVMVGTSMVDPYGMFRRTSRRSGCIPTNDPINTRDDPSPASRCQYRSGRKQPTQYCKCNVFLHELELIKLVEYVWNYLII